MRKRPGRHNGIIIALLSAGVLLGFGAAFSHRRHHFCGDHSHGPAARQAQVPVHVHVEYGHP